MKKTEAYPSKYLTADDVKDGPKVVTIRSVSHEPMTDGKPKPIVYVDGYQKGIVVSKAMRTFCTCWPVPMTTSIGRASPSGSSPSRRASQTERRVRRSVFAFRLGSKKAAKPTKPKGKPYDEAVYDESDPPPHTAEDLDKSRFTEANQRHAEATTPHGALYARAAPNGQAARRDQSYSAGNPAEASGTQPEPRGWQMAAAFVTPMPSAGAPRAHG